MSWIDGIIALSVLAAALRGRSTGALRQIGNAIGAVSGFVAGLWVSPYVVRSLPGFSWRALVGIGVVIFSTIAGAVIGRAIGTVGNRSLRRLHLSSVDATAGAVIAVAQSLAICWLVAGVIVQAAWLPVAGAINRSAIITSLDAALPPVPSLTEKFTHLLDTSNFPTVFASVTAPLVHAVLPTTAPVINVATSVAKVISTDSCGQTREGSAWVWAHGEWATNAHVVAGARQVTVNGAPATVVYINAAHDIALLLGPSATIPARGPATLGSTAAVVGFPQNGALTVTPAAIGPTISAQGRDIYGTSLVTRDVVTLTAAVQPGNSGSPVFESVNGRPMVVAMVFSRSTVQANTAYAITMAQITADLSTVTTRTPVATGACVQP